MKRLLLLATIALFALAAVEFGALGADAIGLASLPSYGASVGGAAPATPPAASAAAMPTGPAATLAPVATPSRARASDPAAPLVVAAAASATSMAPHLPPTPPALPPPPAPTATPSDINGPAATPTASGGAAHVVAPALGDAPTPTATPTATVTSTSAPDLNLSTWRASPAWSGAFLGPTDANNDPWYAPQFDDSAWTSVSAPDVNSIPAGSDRFYRVTVSVSDPASVAPLHLESDDGLWLYVNGQLVGNWGGAWRQEGCVNHPCGVTQSIAPVPINTFLVAGTNVIAARVSNAVYGSYFDIFQQYASISGVITDPTSVGISGATVWAYANGCFCTLTSAAADGSYTLSGLPPGTYQVLAKASGFSYRWYPGVYTFGGTPVQVGDGGALNNIDLTLEPGGTISGVVTGTGGTPIAAATVQAAGADGFLYGATTAADGSYILTDLAPDSYWVDASASGYLTTYYAGTTDFNAVTHVPVAVGGSTPGISFQLASAGGISGIVKDTVGNPLAGITVNASSNSSGAQTVSSADGTYTFTGLAPGSYTVSAGGAATCSSPPPSNGCPSYLVEYYNGVQFLSQATPVVVAGGATTSGIDFALTPAGNVAGTITDGGGNPVAGIYVYAFAQNGGPSVPTASDGTYLITGLAPGMYTVWTGGSTQACYSNPPGPSCAHYPTQYYPGTFTESAATPVTVTSGATISGISFALQPGGSISGTVRDTGGNTLAGIGIQASSNAGYGVTTSASDGTYTIGGLVPGIYSVTAGGSNCSSPPPAAGCFGYVTQTYPATVGVTNGVTASGIDFALTPGGSITGEVSDAHGTPIAGAYVNAQASSCCAYGYAQTAADGTYSIIGLAATTYTVSAGASGHVMQYYNGVTHPNQATAVVVTSGQATSAINFALPLAGSISGTITDSQSVPVAGVYVQATALDGSSGGGSSTANDGTYTIADLAPGSYRVSAVGQTSACYPNPQAPLCKTYPYQYYAGTFDASKATPVNVTSGATTSGISFSLMDGGAISGKITDGHGAGLPGVQVNAYGLEGCCGSTTTAADGTYTITGLAPGSYNVAASASSCGFSPPSADCATYPTQYYRGGVFDFDLATPVSVTAGATTSNIDFAIVPGGSVSGTITGPDALPVAGARVAAIPSTGCCWAYGTTAADGTYAVAGLVPGRYTVSASASSCGVSPPSASCTSYPVQYYPGVFNSASATAINVTGGVDTPGISFALHAGGSIAGKITDKDGVGLSGVQVQANPSPCCGSVGSATTGADGTYEIDGLGTGSYVIFASSAHLPGRYYAGTYDLQAATSVAVTAGAQTANIDLALLPGGSVSGTVKNGQGAGIAGATVYAQGTVCCASSGSAVTAADGSYTVTGLAAGSYDIVATTLPPPYAPQYYNGAYSVSAATPVTVTQSGVTPGIDLVLAAVGSISGKVTDHSGTPLGGVSVTAGPSGGCCFGIGYATTAIDGTYVIGGLLPTNYNVSAQLSGYVTQWYNGANDVTGAVPVAVPPAGGATGIDMSLPPPEALHPLSVFPDFSETRDTTGAGLASGEPQPCGVIGATAWYEIAVPTSPPGYPTISIDTVGSPFNTAVAVYRANGPASTPLSGSTLLKCAADGSQSMVAFTASAGSTYFVQVGGQAGAAGLLTVDISRDTAGDGYTDIMHDRLGKSRAFCSIMRADVNGDGKATILDLSAIAAHYNQAMPPAPARLNQNGDATITILDLSLAAGVYNDPVSACP